MYLYLHTQTNIKYLAQISRVVFYWAEIEGFTNLNFFVCILVSGHQKLKITIWRHRAKLEGQLMGFFFIGMNYHLKKRDSKLIGWDRLQNYRPPEDPVNVIVIRDRIDTRQRNKFYFSKSSLRKVNFIHNFATRLESVASRLNFTNKILNFFQKCLLAGTTTSIDYDRWKFPSKFQFKFLHLD